MKLSSEQVAMLLFGDQAEATLSEEQKQKLSEDIAAMEKRLNLSDKPAEVEEVFDQYRVPDGPIAEIKEQADSIAISDIAERFGPGVAILNKSDENGNVTSTPVVYKNPPASEIPDTATKAFLRELKKEPGIAKHSAHAFLEEASNTMKQRAALRDAEGGERTAAQIAKVFNAITGNSISEADAWMFLIVLKIVRSRNGKYNRDDYVDLAAYAGLLGECESVNR